MVSLQATFNSSTADLIMRFCSKLGYPLEVRKLADFILSKTTELQTLTSRSPNSLVAASIFLAADLLDFGNFRTAKEIGNACGSAANTIKQTIKLMQSQLEKLLPTDFVIKSPSPTRFSTDSPRRKSTKHCLLRNQV